jgi:predicted esterase YcpF (UPF0227 family)
MALKMPRTTHLLYLHGFRSSPKSVKAQKMAAVVQNQHPSVSWWCPQLPASPRQAMALLQAGTADWPLARSAIVGSSLGGFYAACLSRAWGCPAVLLNPAVYPARDLARHIGEHPAWHDPSQKLFFEAAYVQELQDLQDMQGLPLPADANHPGQPVQDQDRGFVARTLAVIAQGDEVLDWREMLARHQGGQVRLIKGSDHALNDFDTWLPEILDFLRLA